MSFYHSLIDPYEMNDLAGIKKYHRKIEEMKKELERWMKDQKDPGIKLDTMEAHQNAKAGNHLF